MVRTEIQIEGTEFLINGRATYAGCSWHGRKLEGLLLNSRMVQAIFDDDNPETCKHWAYPDTGCWDAQRNTDEFCRMLPEYRRHGLLAVTVGLQGGGSIYTPEVYDHYVASAYTPAGDFKQAWLARLRQVLEAADEAGMVVIVNLFYWRQASRIPRDATLQSITERVTAWLLETGQRNILVDVANESHPFWKRPQMEPERIHELIDIARNVTLDGRRLLVSTSAAGGGQLPPESWLRSEDYSLPHGNGLSAEELRATLQRWKELPAWRERPRPVVVNEDSVFTENLHAALQTGCSWGFYCQGYGSCYRDRMDWTEHGREREYEQLSGFQTVPVNWSINTAIKRTFFEELRRITSGQEP